MGNLDTPAWINQPEWIWSFKEPCEPHNSFQHHDWFKSIGKRQFPRAFLNFPTLEMDVIVLNIVSLVRAPQANESLYGDVSFKCSV